MSKPVFSDLFTFRSARRNRRSFALILLVGLGIEVLIAAWIFIPAYSAQQEYAALAASGALVKQPQAGPQSLIPGLILGIARLALWAAVIVAIWAAGAQRFHDLGMSGWSVLWMLVPIVQLYFLYVLFARRGEAGENRFGPDPLAGTITS